MKTLHDMRGEYRRARQRYGNAYNRWRRLSPYHKDKLAAYDRQAAASKLYLERERALAAALGLAPVYRSLFENFHDILMGRAEKPTFGA